MNATLKNMLEVSRNLIGSIERNLKEFGQSHDALMPDYISDHRRPNSAGALAALAGSSATEEVYFEEEEEEHAFDARDYAFNRATRAASPVADAPADSPVRRSPTRNVMSISHMHGLSATAWPTKRCVLHSMESIICGELFVVDYIWAPDKKNTELVAKYYVNKYVSTSLLLINTPYS